MDAFVWLDSIPQINNNDKEMPAMQREKSASLSEVDYAELQKTKAAVEAKALKELEANASVNGQDIPAAASTIATPTTTTTTTGATAAVVTGKSRNAPVRNSVNDFRFGKMIGEGSFSTVFLAKEIRTGKEWASEYIDIESHVVLLFCLWLLRTRDVRKSAVP